MTDEPLPEETPVWSGFTIDGPTSRDLDDAISVEKLESGWRATVYVSDVARKVVKGDRFDAGWEAEPRAPREEDGGKEKALAVAVRVLQDAQEVGPTASVHVRGARERVETKYHSEGSVPMIPRSLSEDRLSLREGFTRQVMRVVVELDEALDPVALADVAFGTFKSVRRLSYPDIPGILTDAGHDMHGPVKVAAQLAERLIEKRREMGAFVLYDLNSGWVVDEDGFLQKLERDDSTFGYVVVQEMMILANQELARWCAANEVPVLFRTHTARAHAPERAEVIAEIRAAMGQAYGVIEQLRQRVHLVMNRARYGPVLRGHYGLNVPCYMHATSPIRRYADLVSQRQVRAKVLGEPYPHTREELDVLAAEINTFKDAQKEATHLHLKDRAMGKAKRQAEVANLLDRLSSAEFDNVVKAATRQGDGRLSEALDEHLRGRLAAGSLSLQAMELVLFEAPWPAWDDVRRLVFARLARNLHEAAGVAHVAVQAGCFEPVQFRDERAGPDHGPVFTSKAKARRGEDTVRGQPVRGKSAKAAQQRAVVNLLAALLGFDPPEWLDGAVPTPVPTRAEPPKPDAPVGSDNPVAALQEWCQAVGAPVPDYSFGQEGPPHVPTFTCSCRVAGVEGVARGSNKKEVKRLAAADAVRLLRAGVQGQAAGT